MAGDLLFTTIDVPGMDNTHVYAIDGGNIGGYYNADGGGPHGFLFDGSTYTFLDVPGSTSTAVYGMEGNIVVGSPAFRYDGSTYTFLDVPGATSTTVHGIGNGIIVGSYRSDGPYSSHGYMYDGSTYTTIDPPGSTRTMVFDIDNGNVVGWYVGTDRPSPHGFVFDGSTYTTIDVPGASKTLIFSIDGDTFGGSYKKDGDSHGFIAVPAPPSPPEAHAGGPYTIFLGESVILDAGQSTDPNYDIASYRWDLDGDEAFETDAGEQYTYEATPAHLASLGVGGGHNTISVLVTDGEGLSDTHETLLTIMIYGDANFDGFVDDTDLAILLANWEQDPGTITTWELGNFTQALGDTDVDDTDLSILLGNWTGPPPAGAAVPELATLSLLALGGLAVMRRRRRGRSGPV